MNNDQNEEMLRAIAEAPAEQTDGAAPEGGTEAAGENSELAAKCDELAAKVGELEAELLRERIKVLLLISGILPEKLDDGAAMAYGLCLAGKTPESAASEIIEAYPHLRAVRREMPAFSTDSKGSDDGFSAIRRIFSMK